MCQTGVICGWYPFPVLLTKSYIDGWSLPCILVVLLSPLTWWCKKLSNLKFNKWSQRFFFFSSCRYWFPDDSAVIVFFFYSLFHVNFSSVVCCNLLAHCTILCYEHLLAVAYILLLPLFHPLWRPLTYLSSISTWAFPVTGISWMWRPCLLVPLLIQLVTFSDLSSACQPLTCNTSFVMDVSNFFVSVGHKISGFLIFIFFFAPSLLGISSSTHAYITFKFSFVNSCL